MAAFLDEVQQIVGADLSEAQVLRRLQDIGTRLYDLLLPEDMQAYLWEHRNEIGDLIVYADEPYVPRELCISSHPGVRGQKKPRFLRKAAWCVGVSAASRRRRSDPRGRAEVAHPGLP